MVWSVLPWWLVMNILWEFSGHYKPSLDNIYSEVFTHLKTIWKSLSFSFLCVFSLFTNSGYKPLLRHIIWRKKKTPILFVDFFPSHILWIMNILIFMMSQFSFSLEHFALDIVTVKPQHDIACSRFMPMCFIPSLPVLLLFVLICDVIFGSYSVLLHVMSSKIFWVNSGNSFV